MPPLLLQGTGYSIRGRQQARLMLAASSVASRQPGRPPSPAGPNLIRSPSGADLAPASRQPALGSSQALGLAGRCPGAGASEWPPAIQPSSRD